jgi:hypothetical protein
MTNRQARYMETWERDLVIVSLALTLIAPARPTLNIYLIPSVPRPIIATRLNLEQHLT